MHLSVLVKSFGLRIELLTNFYLLKMIELFRRIVGVHGTKRSTQVLRRLTNFNTSMGVNLIRAALKYPAPARNRTRDLLFGAHSYPE